MSPRSASQPPLSVSHKLEKTKYNNLLSFEALRLSLWFTLDSSAFTILCNHFSLCSSIENASMLCVYFDFLWEEPEEWLMSATSSSKAWHDTDPRARRSSFFFIFSCRHQLQAFYDCVCVCVCYTQGLEIPRSSLSASAHPTHKQGQTLVELKLNKKAFYFPVTWAVQNWWTKFNQNQP